jgi:hypothetical protein
MTNKGWMKRFVIALVAVAALQIPLTLLAARDSEDCEEVARWATGAVENMPHTLAALSSVPEYKRRALFTLFTPEEKAGVFREQLLQLRNSQGLTLQQVAVVDRALHLLSPALYSGPKSAEREKAFRQLEADVKAAFWSPNQRRAFHAIGPRSAMSGGPVAWMSGLVTVFARQEYCECSNDSDWCGDKQECGNDGNGCTRQEGCGTLGQYTCDGECIIIPPGEATTH